jgi:UDP-glucose 4-epimerase
MRVLITGVAGFLGSRLADWIIEHIPDAEVIGIDNLSGGYKENLHDLVEFFPVDILDDKVSEVFSTYRPDYVFHFAAFAAEGLSPFVRSHNYRNNLEATSKIVTECIKNDVTRLIFSSTMGVYGDNPTPFYESDQPNPIDPYGIAKYACELDIRVAGEHHGLDWCIIRPHNVYGVKQNIWDRYRNVLGIWMHQHINGLPMTIYGDGEQTRAFSYIDDCLEPLWKSSQESSCSKQIINLGGTKYYSMNEANEIIRKVMGGGTLSYKEKRYEVKNAYSSYQKSIDLLGYNDKTSLIDGLTTMWNWVKTQPNRVSKGFDQYELDKGLYSFWK